MNARKIAIVFNPVGGSANKGTIHKLQQLLSQGGRQVSLFPTTAEPGSATSLAAQAVREGYDLVIASGGDGTVCQVTEALQNTGIAMAVFPGGTGNVFARSFYAVPSPEDFAAMVNSGQPQAVDLIEIEYTDVHGALHKRLCIAGIGLGKLSDAISDAKPFFKRIFGKLVYVARISKACLLPGANKFELETAEGSQKMDALAVFILNVLPPAMSMLSRGCNASDGRLDVVVLPGSHAGHALSNILSLAFGRPSRRPPMRTKELTIRCDTPIRPNIDGDPSEATTCVRMRAKEAAVNVVLST